MLNRIRSVLKTQSPYAILLEISRRIYAPKAKCFSICEQWVNGRSGLEIGGPSRIFGAKGLLPVYPVLGKLDNCNFASTTVWGKGKIEGPTFCFDAKKSAGNQYIAEATELSLIPSSSYDFVLSSHTLEHIANPVKALLEWVRVLKNEGILALILPHKDWTFDHRRPATTLAHLVEDYEFGTTEKDLTHLPEILLLHDLNRDSGIDNKAAFKKRSESNFENRCLHHHVFDEALVVDLIDYIGMQILAIEFKRPFHIILIAQKICPDLQRRNKNFIKHYSTT